MRKQHFALTVKSLTEGHCSSFDEVGDVQAVLKRMSQEISARLNMPAADIANLIDRGKLRVKMQSRKALVYVS